MHKRFEVDLAGLRRWFQGRELPDGVEGLADLGPPDHGRVAGGYQLNVELLHTVYVSFELVSIEQLEPRAVHAVEELESTLPLGSVEFADVVHRAGERRRERVDGPVDTGAI